MERKTPAQIEAAATIMQTCVAYLLLSDMIKEDNGDVILRLNGYIEKNMEKTLDVDTLCREFSLSRNALYRLSHTFFGMPIATYIRNKKMDTAAALLMEGKSVSQVALCVGFDDYNYFSKVFRAVKGAPPRAFKKK
jgi:AraC-like DNA-binding protein